MQPLYSDPFQPVLKSPGTFSVTEEQGSYIKRILDKSCSDSKFAEKAFAAITLVLTNASVAPPVVSSITPTSVVIGDPSFVLKVMGTGFTPTSQITLNGMSALTSYVSPTELNTNVDMTLVTVSSSILVSVIGAVESLPFEITSPVM